MSKVTGNGRNHKTVAKANKKATDEFMGLLTMGLIGKKKRKKKMTVRRLLRG